MTTHPASPHSPAPLDILENGTRLICYQQEHEALWDALGLQVRRPYQVPSTNNVAENAIGRGGKLRAKRMRGFKRRDTILSIMFLLALLSGRGAPARVAFGLHCEGWMPMILDETGLKDRAMLLGAGTWCRGRALPLALYARHYERTRKSPWAYREGLLSVMRESLSPSQRSRLLPIADRGYASTAFFRPLLKAQVASCIRVSRKVLLAMAHQEYRLEFLAAEFSHGDCHFLTDVRYGPAKAKLNLLLWWEADQPEPWLIATTLSTAQETRHYYRLRMGIEEMFKDLKHTFAWESCQCRSTDRVTRLGLFALVSFWALALRVRYPSQWVRYVTARGALSFLTLAPEWVHAPPHLRTALRAEAETG